MEERLTELRERIRRYQHEDGSFGCRYVDDVKGDVTDHRSCVFTSSMILCRLSSLEDLAEVKKHIFEYMTNEMIEHRSVNAWKCLSKDERDGIPDRLDITCEALSGLTLFQKEMFTPEVLMNVVMLLMGAEAEEGGPYRTWAVNDARVSHLENGIDPVVNANVAFFLGLHDIRLDNVDAHLNRFIDEGTFRSPFYVTQYPVIYALSRAVDDAGNGRMRSFLLEMQESDGGWGNPLQTSLAVSSLLRLGERGSCVERGVDYLLCCETEEIANAYPLFIHPLKAAGWCGHEAITIAHCLEALELYKQSIEYRTLGSDAEASPSASEHRSPAVSFVEDRMKQLSEPLAGKAEAFLTFILNKDRDGQIASLPAMFQSSLHRKDVSEDVVTKLCAANVYGWMAYTIFDDFLDEEGDASSLSVATFCLRELTGIYGFFGPPVRELFQYTMDLVDGANAWELANCRMRVANGNVKIPERLPDYEMRRKLAKRSLGHALGPLTLLLLSGYARSSKEVSAVKTHFVHALIAKQLCDDLEDWEDDFRKGQLNYVSTDLLRRRSNDRKGTSDSIPMEELLLSLRKIFWYDALPDFSQTISEHVQRAESSIASMRAMIDPARMIQDVNIYQDVAENILMQRGERMALIASLNDAPNVKG